MTLRVPLWGVAMLALVAGGVVVAQGYEPGNEQSFEGPLTITGSATATGDITADHFHATAPATENAFNAVEGAHYVFNDPTSTVYMDYDGTNLAVNGAPLSTGSNNIKTTGRYCTDAACTTAYIVNDTFGTMNLIGSVGGSGNWTTAGSFNTDDYLKIGATAVSGGNACSAGNEGKIRRDTAAGGTSGARTRICLCTSDGAGTPAYAWQNIVSGTVGTTTACNP